MEMKVCTIGRETISIGGEKVFTKGRKYVLQEVRQSRYSEMEAQYGTFLLTEKQHLQKGRYECICA